MDPLSIVVGAIIAGATAGATEVANQSVKDAYVELKALISRRFASKSDVVEAIEKVEQQPKAEHRQAYLKGELQNAGVEKDSNILQQAKAVLDLLKEVGTLSDTQYQLVVSGSGAAAASGGIAAGAGGLAAHQIEGDIHLGSSPAKQSDKNGE